MKYPGKPFDRRNDNGVVSNLVCCLLQMVNEDPMWVDPATRRKAAKTPNQRGLEVVGSYWYAFDKWGPEDKRTKERRGRLLDWFWDQDHFGHQTISKDGGKWGYGGEQGNSSHHELWELAVGSCLLMALRNGDTFLADVCTRWLAVQTSLWAYADPSMSGRVIMPGARIYAMNKVTCERGTRNNSWRLYLSRHKANEKLPWIREQLDGAEDSSFVLKLCLMAGWEWPDLVPVETMRLATGLVRQITWEGEEGASAIESVTIVAVPPICWTRKTGWEFTRYFPGSGLVQFEPFESGNPETVSSTQGTPS